jgi:hypothetical protein
MPLKLIDGNNRFRARWEKLGPNALSILYNESITHMPNHTLIWVWDGENGAGPRREIFPMYKGGRKPGSDQFHETMALFQDLLQHSNCLQLAVPGVEADDVIACLAQGSSDVIEIDSNDADFLALVSERITVNREPIAGVIPDYVHLYKTLVGDKSDNVKGLPSFGAGTWGKLEDSERILLIKHFTGESRLTGEDCSELFGWGKALCSKWEDNLADLDVAWKITDFFPVDSRLISEHLKAGVLNMDAANALLAPLLFTMDHEKVA